MKKAILFGCMFILAFLGNAQGIVLQQGFKGSRVGKGFSDSNFVVRVDSGTMYMQKLKRNLDSRGCLWYREEVNGYQTSKDFSISFQGEVLSTDDIAPLIDFQWGAMQDDIAYSQVDSLYQIEISDKGVRLAYFRKGSKPSWQYNPWSHSNKDSASFFQEIFTKQQPHEYNIAQRQGFVYVSIDGKLVYSIAAVPIAGNGIGIQQCLKSAWMVSKLKVEQNNVDIPIAFNAGRWMQ